MKKLFAILMSVALMLSLAVPSMAATVENETNHNYDVYQVLKGTQNDINNESELGDIEWGDGVNDDHLLNDLQTDPRFNLGTDSANIFASCETAADVAEVLSGYSDDTDVAKAFANVAANNRTNKCATVKSNAVSPDLAAGYYLFIDSSDVSGEYDANNSALLQLTKKGTVTISKKYTTPSVDKDITKVEDDVYVNGIEAADVNIGDTVTFTITGTLPSNYADYETYTYIFYDTMHLGLTYEKDAKVYVVNDEIKTEVSGFNTDYNEESGKLIISCGDLKRITGVSIDADSKIVVEYTATLNENAEIGQLGNKNKVYLEYSNNPNHIGDGVVATGKTPDDEVLIFTYKLDVTKVDGKAPDTKLSGAEFVLYREIAGADGSTVKEYVQVAENDKITDWTTDKAQASPLLSDESGLFKVIGLDAGTYYLKETKAPAGYNLLTDPIKFEIKATVVDGENAPALESLSITVGNDTQPGDLTTGVVGTTVQNNKGVTLPETGGMGTTIFYIVGGVMVAAAVVLLITKKRMSAEG